MITILALSLLILPQATPAAPSGDAVRRLVVEGARSEVGRMVLYDGQYRRIGYPGGDLPPDRGSCTDVVIRAYRRAGVDLQRLVHEDMLVAFGAYPRLWRLSHPDSNIDHRRVPNLATFFQRRSSSIPASRVPADFKPGDIVVWAIPTPHIGVVSDVTTDGRPLVFHNIGAGAVLEDVLFAFPITGHYRFPA